MALEMKYFILKPKSKYADDPFAKASRRAMEVYAESIREKDPLLASSLFEWVHKENNREIELKNGLPF